MECPCQENVEYSQCCEPYISGEKSPQTAEQLLRSRYTAFTMANMDYISKTHDPKTRHEADMEANKQWAESVEWLGMKLLGVDGGGPKDQEAYLEFKCFYEDEEGEEHEHHEVSQFRKKQGKWFFTEATHLEGHQDPFVREEPKVGRNDPCPCDSGKKYKKCCGAN